MATVSLTNWNIPVGRIVLECSDDDMITEITRDATIEIAKAIKPHYALEAINSVAAQADYDVTNGLSSLIYISRVWWDTGSDGSYKSLMLRTQEDLNDSIPDWPNESGDPQYYYIVDGDTIQLVPTPDSVKEFKVEKFYRPSETATSVEDIFWNRYQLMITYLTASMLLAMPDRVWSDRTAAIDYWQRYQNALDIEITKGSRQALGARFPARRAAPYVW